MRILLLLSIFCFHSSVAAQSTWIYEIENCKDLTAGITSHFGGRTPSDLSPTERVDLRIVLFEACSPKFSHCGLSVCAHALELEKESERPFFWLDSVSSCAEFKKQFRDRYSFVRNLASRPEDLEMELGYVFHRICQRSFDDCTIGLCETHSVQSVNATTPANRRALEQQRQYDSALKKYDELVAERFIEHAAAIEIKIAAEKDAKMDWVIAANPLEMETLRKRRSEEVKPSRRSDKETPSVQPRTPRYPGNSTQPGRSEPIRRRGPRNSQNSPLVY